MMAEGDEWTTEAMAALNRALGGAAEPAQPYRAADFRIVGRSPSGRPRTYVDTRTGEVLSRRRRDERIGTTRIAREKRETTRRRVARQLERGRMQLRYRRFAGTVHDYPRRGGRGREPERERARVMTATYEDPPVLRDGDARPLAEALRGGDEQQLADVLRLGLFKTWWGTDARGMDITSVDEFSIGFEEV
jgi:hypothetical protein